MDTYSHTQIDTSIPPSVRPSVRPSVHTSIHAYIEPNYIRLICIHCIHCKHYYCLITIFETTNQRDPNLSELDALQVQQPDFEGARPVPAVQSRPSNCRRLTIASKCAKMNIIDII